MQSKLTVAKLISACIFLCAIIACNNSDKIPFSTTESIFPQPVSQAIQFSDPIHVSLSDSATKINPSIKNIDFNKLPSSVFDSAGFLPFQKPPEVAPFNWNKLPDTAFNYESLPSKPLKFETSILESPKIIKAGTLKPKKQGNELVFEFGEPFTGVNINCIYQDNNDFLWIAAEKSLYRYDGVNLAIYLQGQLPITSSILEDSLGRIWLGTFSSGIFMLDTRNGIIKHLAAAQGLAGNQIIRMITDRQNRIWATTGLARAVNIIDENAQTIKEFGKQQGLLSGSLAGGIARDNMDNIWITNIGGGISIVDIKSNKIKYLKKEQGLSTDSIVVTMQDNQNRIWVTGYEGQIDLIDTDHGEIRHFYKQQGHKTFIFNLLQDNEGLVWLTNTSGNFILRNAYGIEIIDPGTMSTKMMNSASGLASNEINKILQDRYGQFWVATSAGLNMIKRKGISVRHVGDKDISTILEDSHGRIWIQSLSEGIGIFDAATGQVKSLTAGNGLSSNRMNDMTEIDGKIWVTSDKGIDILDPTLKRIEHIGKEEGLQNIQVGGLIKNKENKIWMGGFLDARINLLDWQNKSIRHLSSTQPLNDTNIVLIKEDKQSLIWTASYSGGVSVIDPAKGTIKYLENAPGAKDDCGKALLQDEKGNMWIGTDKGIYIVNVNRDSLLLLSSREGLLNNEINSLIEYDHRVYVGTKEGLNMITPPWVSSADSWQIVSFGKLRGVSKLTGTFISNLITKKREYWWGDRGVTILNGLSGFSDSSGSVSTNLTGVDLLNEPLYFLNNEPLTENKEDTLWSSKKDTFYLKGQLPSRNKNVDNIKWDSITGAYNMPVNLQLPYDKNYLQFHFAQAHLGSGDTIWYRYILEGIDKKWSVKTYNNFSENYLNLPPNDYIFKVSSLSNGTWSNPVEFNFRISPPWWQTWWAYALYIVAFFLAVWSFIIWRTRSLKKEKQLLEKNVAIRTHQLKQEKEKVESTLLELKSTQAQLIQSEKMASLGELTAGIAHEIQNPLNFVNNFSEVNKELLAEMKEEIGKGNLEEVKAIAKDIEDNEEKINHHGRRADAIVKGMLQHSRHDSGVKEPTDINKLADEYLRLSYHGLRAKDKSFNAMMKTDFDETIGKISIIPQDIGRVLLNLINNAFYAVSEKQKQNLKGYEPAVTVSTAKQDGKIEITVKDNGNGIPGKIVDKIFQPFFTTKPTGQGTGLGLSLSYDIVKAHGGKLKVETKEGDGTNFTIELPV
ncbi:MAG: two-component regulator propeller domain-containing protein [Chitinophagaceae bacterium]